jgi:hypothetical protein
MDFANLFAHSPQTEAAAGLQKTVHDSLPHLVHICKKLAFFRKYALLQ